MWQLALSEIIICPCVPKKYIYVVFYVGLEMESLDMWIYMERAGFLNFEAALLALLSEKNMG